MTMKDVDSLSTDFLIIGGGAAGCMAAIRAKELRPEMDVTVIEKAEISRSGAAGRGMDALNNVVVPGIGTVEEYLESLEIVFDGIFEPTVSRVIAERSFNILRRLEGWGLHFPRGSDGNYIVRQFHPKGRFLVEMRGELKLALAENARKTGATVLNRHCAVEILRHDGQVAGAIVFDLKNDRFKVVTAPSVLLATGGCARIGLPHTGYLHGTFDCPWCNGEAYKLGYEAGAELTGFEYTGCSATVRDYNGPGLSTFIRHGAHLINGLGERFMSRYDSKRMERAPARTRMWAMYKELIAGRGPIAFSFDHLPEETISLIESGIFETERPTMEDFLSKREIDLRRTPLEVVISEVYLCGGHGLAGLVGDAWGETSVRGLFAAGDCLSNPFGFLAGAMAMGEVAGEAAANRKEDIPARPASSAERMDRVMDSRNRHQRGALRVGAREFEYKFRRLVNELVAPPKSGAKLQKFLDQTEIMTREQDDILASDPHEFMKALEVKAGLFSARMAAMASLFRQESRFGFFHHRVDYPEKDDANWTCRVIISRGSEGPVLKKERGAK